MQNVVRFPKHNPRATETSLEEVQAKINIAKEKYVNALVDHHCGQLLANISLSGIEIETDSFMTDFAFTVETVRSSMYRSMGLVHPLQEQIDEAVELVDTEEDEDFDDSGPLIDFGYDEDEDDE